MKDKDKKKIEEMMREIQCQKNFKCAKSGFEHLCEAKDIGMKDFLECHEENPLDCSFAMMSGKSHYCTCRIRIHIAKRLKM